ncbi:hypothetical protein RKD46_002665 [Streptomyces pseudovenezuelae]
MGGPLGGADRRGKDVRHAPDPGQRHVQFDRVQRGEAEQLVTVPGQGHPAGGGGGVGAVPGRGQIGDRLVADPDVVRQQGTEVPGEPQDPLGSEPLAGPRAGDQVHGRPRFRTGLGGQRPHPVRTVVARRPLHGRGVRRTGAAADHADPLGDHEAREQTDPELPEEVRADLLESLGPLGTAPDGGQQVVHVRLGESDPGVLDPQGAVLGVQPHAGRGVRLLGPPGRDRVHRVLQQFAEIDLRAGVEVMGEEVHQTAQVDLERVRLLRYLGCL